MRTKLSVLTCFYALGIICGQKINISPNIFFIACIILQAISAKRLAKGRQIYIIICLSLFFLGATLCSGKLHTLNELGKKFDKQNIVIMGQIYGDVSKKDKLNTYTIHVDKIETTEGTYLSKCNIKVVDYKNTGSYIVPYNYVKISGEFNAKNTYKNIGLFNYYNFLHINGILGIIDADYSSKIESQKSSSRYFESNIYKVKQSIETILSKNVEPLSFAMLKGIMFGDTSDIGEDDYESFKKCGIVHIFAVSGYNIWLVYAILNNLFFFLNNKKSFKICIIIFLLAIYTIMSGASPSVLRAFIMAAIVLLGRIIKRKADPLNSLFIAAFLILIFNPLLLMDTGFQLSFLSVASIILIFPQLKNIKLSLYDKVKDSIMLTLSVQIGILPLLLYYFNSISVLSLIANLIIVPIVSAFTVLGILLYPINVVSSSVAIFIGKIIDLLAKIIISEVKYINSFPFANINSISPSITEMILYYIIILILFKIIIIDEKYKKLIFFTVAVIMFLPLVANIYRSELKISFIDVGQGDSILVCTPDKKNILIDGGGKAENSFSSIDIGEDIIKPYLLKHGIKRIDMVISTHSHYDHLQGLIAVAENFEIDNFVKPYYVSTKLYENILRKNPNIEMIDVKQGDRIDAGRYVNLYILNPYKGNEDENDTSVVFKLVYKNFSALLTGDISENIEKGLIDKNIKSTILKIPHHGSSTSLNEEFIDAVDPESAIICVGKNNFGHPSDRIIKELEEKKIKYYRTDNDGEIVITTSGNGFKVKTAVN